MRDINTTDDGFEIGDKDNWLNIEIIAKGKPNLTAEEKRKLVTMVSTKLGEFLEGKK